MSPTQSPKPPTPALLVGLEAPRGVCGYRRTPAAPNGKQLPARTWRGPRRAQGERPPAPVPALRSPRPQDGLFLGPLPDTSSAGAGLSPVTRPHAAQAPITGPALYSGSGLGVLTPQEWVGGAGQALRRETTNKEQPQAGAAPRHVRRPPRRRCRGLEAGSPRPVA